MATAGSGKTEEDFEGLAVGIRRHDTKTPVSFAGNGRCEPV
jgi:hypothetical protein